MKSIILLLATSLMTVSVSFAQRVQGTLKKGAQANEIVIAIKPTQSFTALMSNLAVSVQIPKAAVNNVRPEIAFTNLQSGLFATWTKVDADQGDEFYTWGFNCVAPGASNTDATNWPLSELEVLKISFLGQPLQAGFSARLCHYLDGGLGSYAIFYVETSLAAVNGGVLSDWGSLFYGTGATNGTTANGSIGVPNANYSYVPVGDVNLPVKFLSFLALKNGDNARLTWTVENDQDNKLYEIERSFNARDFEKVGTVAALNNGKTQNTYEITDTKLSSLNNKTIFYRVRQIDYNGNGMYSAIRSVNIDFGSAVTLYPNPVKSTTKLVIDAEQPGKAAIIIRDFSGKLVQQINTQLFKGINQQDLNVANLASGEYNVTVMGTGFNYNLKLTKIN